MTRNTKRVERGDFQTPEDLARQVCGLLKKNGVEPGSIIEPTCGAGTFFIEALNAFDEAREGYACDIDEQYIEVLRNRLPDYDASTHIRTEVADFFSKDWESDLRNLPEPILMIGNPPWVTNSQLGQLGSDNLPLKRVYVKFVGI